jgi:uncharacterized protein (TIGR02996 family)
MEDSSMTDEAGFLRALQENPADDDARLVYADWLEERGDIRGEYLRLEHQLAQIPLRLAQLRQQIDPAWLASCGRLTGTWSIMWVGDPANTNPIKLSQSGDTIEGTYLSDSREMCKVTGRIDHKMGSVSFTIKGASAYFVIQCDGIIAGASLVEGRYEAYGNSAGSFRMSRIGA